MFNSVFKRLIKNESVFSLFLHAGLQSQCGCYGCQNAYEHLQHHLPCVLFHPSGGFLRVNDFIYCCSAAFCTLQRYNIPQRRCEITGFSRGRDKVLPAAEESFVIRSMKYGFGIDHTGTKRRVTHDSLVTLKTRAYFPSLKR